MTAQTQHCRRWSVVYGILFLGLVVFEYLFWSGYPDRTLEQLDATFWVGVAGIPAALWLLNSFIYNIRGVRNTGLWALALKKAHLKKSLSWRDHLAALWSGTEKLRVWSEKEFREYFSS